MKEVEDGEMITDRKVLVIINEQHTLLSDQARALNEKFGEDGWACYNVPAEGWTAEQQQSEAQKLFMSDLVFVSPIPLLLRDCAQRDHFLTYVMHNDKREKKELPGGKVISTVAKNGWEIL